MALRPAVAAVHLQQLPLLDRVADRHRLEPDRLPLAPAPGLVPVSLDLHKLGKSRDQLGDAALLVSVRWVFETAIAPSGWPQTCARMTPLASIAWSIDPTFRKTALGHGRTVTCRFGVSFFARQVIHADVEPQLGLPVQAEASTLRLPGLSVLWSKETPMRYSRSRSQAADGDDSVILLIRQGGFSTLSQRGQDVSLEMGDGVAFLGAEPASATVSEVECIALVTPRTVLRPTLRDVESKTMRLVRRNCEALRLVTAYLGTLRELPSLTTPELRHVVATHVHDLIAMALGPTRDGAALASRRGVRAARLKAIMADILVNANDQSFTVTTIARRHGFTPRYIHKLFEAESSTFPSFCSVCDCFVHITCLPIHALPHCP